MRRLKLVLLALALAGLCAVLSGCDESTVTELDLFRGLIGSVDANTPHEHLFISEYTLDRGYPIEYNAMGDVVRMRVEYDCNTRANEYKARFCVLCRRKIYVLNRENVVLAHTPKDHWRRVSDPTCTNEGMDVMECDRCSKVLVSRSVLPLGHDYKTVSGYAATCTEEGRTNGKHCLRCLEQTGFNSIPALGHDWGEAVYAWSDDHAACTATRVCLRDKDHVETKTVSATVQVTGNPCTEGITTVYMAEFPLDSGFDKQTFTEQKPASHVVEELPAVAATCSETGLTAGKKCTVCGEILVAQETVSARGHTPVEDAAVPATCTEPGKTAGSHCSACNEVLTAQETVPAKEHTPVDDAAVPATCTEPGKTAGSHCSVCSEVLIAQETVPAKGHTPMEDAAVPATCTEPGKTAGSHCLVCGEVLIAQETVPAKGHTPVDDAAVAATCVSKGKTQGSHCSECGMVLVAQQETNIDPNNHAALTTVGAMAATCTSGGYSGTVFCMACGENGDYTCVSEGTFIDALGHAFTNGICDRCGASQDNGGSESGQSTQPIDPSHESKPAEGGDSVQPTEGDKPVQLSEGGDV